MNRYLFLLLLSCCFFADLPAQNLPVLQDSLLRNDSIRKNQEPITRPATIPVNPDSLAARDAQPSMADTLAKNPVKAIVPIDYSTTPYHKVLAEIPWFNFTGKAVVRTISPRKDDSKDGVFYLLMVLFFLLAVIRALFGRYFQNLFTVFFRASMKQKQIREQLLQTPLASLLLNILFIGTGGLLLTFILQDKFKTSAGPINFWWLYGYSVVGLTLLYLGKFFLLKLIGWTLRMEETIDTYIFIVFMCNKVLAIILLPLLLVVAFGSPAMAIVAITVCYVLVVGILAYRYISSYGYINREVRASRFHFFLYLCAFEVAPLLLIYKVLLKFV
ncbi:DUF4271 domain-containing protein [Flavihumibacter fluvii]|uniref:DUF4271 domain-containing protein n=1 Tax=Flavihumibacter fluvii TaxID=2838157 RepID=UPI001BDDD30D|nr:DUF4271 domain-containing protein [Flavihumibacter fluvii]ULQ52455.1 DUF4271 domain-containing protein [Flavihumibacter fluvii]